MHFRVYAALSAAMFAACIGLQIGKGTFGQSPKDRYREYIIQGQRLLVHGTLVSPLVADDSAATPSTLMPPLYGLLVAGIYRTLGLETMAATALLQCVNSLAAAATVCLAAATVRRIASRRAAFAASLLLLVNPTLIGFTEYIWDTSLFTLGVTLCTWWAVGRDAGPYTVRAFFFYGILLGGLALLNPALTLAYPILVLWMHGRCDARRGPSRFASAAAATIGWAVAIAPWTIRNYAHFKEWTYIRNGLLHEVWMGVCPEADAPGASNFQANFPLNNRVSRERVGRIGESAYLDECGRKAIQAISEGPARYARLVVLRLVDYWFGTVFTHPENPRGWRPASTGRAIVMVFLLAETAAGIAGLLMRRSALRDVYWLGAILFIFSMVYAFTHVQVRFRAPIEPLVALFIAAVWFARRSAAGSTIPPAIDHTNWAAHD